MQYEYELQREPRSILQVPHVFRLLTIDVDLVRGLGARSRSLNAYGKRSACRAHEELLARSF